MSSLRSIPTRHLQDILRGERVRVKQCTNDVEWCVQKSGWATANTSEKKRWLRESKLWESRAILHALFASLIARELKRRARERASKSKKRRAVRK